jgi:hypothetical protein
MDPIQHNWPCCLPVGKRLPDPPIHPVLLRKKPPLVTLKKSNATVVQGCNILVKPCSELTFVCYLD